MEDILDVVQVFELTNFSFIYINFNRDAHLLDKLCFESVDDFIWSGVFLEWLFGIHFDA